MTPNSLEVRIATSADRLPLFRMLELYQYDLSDIWDQDLDVHGEFGYELDRYWSQANCHPFVALIDGHYAGFALVDGSVKVAKTGHWMDQFFVLKKYRRSGIGKAIAMNTFKALPGYWEVGQMTPKHCRAALLANGHCRTNRRRLLGAGSDHRLVAGCCSMLSDGCKGITTNLRAPAHRAAPLP
jgi:predicted acetyltransferase